MPIQHWSENIWVVELNDEPAFSEDMLSLLADLQKREDVPDIVLDLTRLRHLNSSNISQMLRIRKIATDSDSSLRLAGPSDGVWIVFMTTGIDKIFEFSQDVASALAALQMGA